MDHSNSGQERMIPIDFPPRNPYKKKRPVGQRHVEFHNLFQHQRGTEENKKEKDGRIK